MHDVEMLAAWFLLTKVGMILTMLMPRMVSESRSSEVNQDECKYIPARQGLHERAGSIISIAKEA